MSLTLVNLRSAVQAAIATDPILAALPFVAQVAVTTAEQSAVGDYNDLLNAALKDPGLVLVFVPADGEETAGHRTPVLHLENRALLCVVENDRQNQTGRTAWEILRRCLAVLKRYQADTKGARADIALDRPAWQLGPLNQGTTVFFLNLVIRTTEDLGPVTA